MTAKTLDPLVSPVTASELADWLGVDDTDTLLAPMLASATDAVIRFLGYDLEPREWTLTLWDWPALGTGTWPNLSPSSRYFNREIDLPYAAIQSVESVSVYGQEVTDFTVRGDSILMAHGAPYCGGEGPSLEVEYTAGLTPISPSILDAIKMLASFLYEHRGACDVMDGLRRSGAAMLLQPYRKYGVVF